jgi:hypothetical protein
MILEEKPKVMRRSRKKRFLEKIFGICELRERERDEVFIGGWKR